jgi:hypothetical protein
MRQDIIPGSACPRLRLTRAGTAVRTLLGSPGTALGIKQSPEQNFMPDRQNISRQYLPLSRGGHSCQILRGSPNPTMLAHSKPN